MIKVYENFFSEDESQKIYNEVIKDEGLWKRYNHSAVETYGTHFFRIIQDSMLKLQRFDKDDIFDSYKSNGTFKHPAHILLKEKFQTIYDKVEYLDEFSRPGFNIGRIGETEARIWHYDDEKFYYPYKNIFFDYTKFNDYFDEVFTLTIMLSKGNFSYDYFDETYTKYDSPNVSICQEHIGLKGDICTNPNCILKEYKTINYQVGDLIIASGRELHRGGKSDYNNNQLRITFQGHGVVKDGICYLYW